MRFFFLILFTCQISFAQTTEMWLKIEYKNQPADSVRVADVERLTFMEHSDGYSGTVTDIDGNEYHTVIIGDQEWTVENLKVTRYNDGTVIPKITNNSEWFNTTNGAYCAYNNNENYVEAYGYLYNWHSVNTGKLAPATGGWKVPSDTDWSNLAEFIGGASIAGNKLKATNGWYNNGNGTDNYHFNALPGGYRSYSPGDYYDIGYYGYWWSSTAENSSNAFQRLLAYNYSNLFRSVYYPNFGYSVRLVRDIQ